jgi:hypothetical protein
VGDAAFLQEPGFPVQCTYVAFVMEPTETGFQARITERCPNLPNQRVKGIYCCDDHAELAGSRGVIRAIATEQEGVRFPR